MQIDKNPGLNVTVSKIGQEILDKFESTGYFGTTQIEIAKIAISYALGNNYDIDIDLDNYEIGESKNKWAMSSLKETFFEELIRTIRPDVNNINMALRNLLDIGLKKMYDDLWDDRLNKLEIQKLFEIKI